MKICLLNETESFLFHFFHTLITLFHFSPGGKSEHIFLCMILREQWYHVTNFARKAKVLRRNPIVDGAISGFSGQKSVPE